MLGFLQRLKEQMRGGGLGFLYERCIQLRGHRSP
jgi:predicted transcriptional regulator